MPAQTPAQIDAKLAALFNEHYAAEDKLAMYERSTLQIAGAEFYYRRRQRVTDMPLAEAEARLEAALAGIKADDYGYSRLPAPCSGSSSSGNARYALAGLAEQRQRLTELKASIDALQALYTGWSRFYLVTSSAGHIHSSMHCSTCRLTTRYGWLPELSGQSEEQAVAEMGPTLCSICYPSAPLAWTEGKKLTAAQAARKAA